MLFFTKTHVCGNDFIIIQARPLHEGLIRTMGHRNFGIGFDQLITFELPHNVNDGNVIHVRFFNKSGNEALMCCNGLLSLVKLLTTDGYITTKDGTYSVRILTPTQEVKLQYANNVSYVTLPKPNIINISKNEAVVDVGNLHIVRFENNTDANIENICEELQKMYNTAMRKYPNGINAHIVLSTANTLEVHTLEHGAGITLSCGSGEVAAAYAAKAMGIVNTDNITIKSRGGTGKVEINEALSTVTLSKGADVVFRGIYQMIHSK